MEFVATLLIVIAVIVGGWALGWFVLGPLISGFMPGTSPEQAAYGTGKRVPWKR